MFKPCLFLGGSRVGAVVFPCAPRLAPFAPALRNARTAAGRSRLLQQFSRWLRGRGLVAVPLWFVGGFLVCASPRPVRARVAERANRGGAQSPFASVLAAAS